MITASKDLGGTTMYFGYQIVLGFSGTGLRSDISNHSPITLGPFSMEANGSQIKIVKYSTQTGETYEHFTGNLSGSLSYQGASEDIRELVRSSFDRDIGFIIDNTGGQPIIGVVLDWIEGASLPPGGNDNPGGDNPGYDDPGLAPGDNVGQFFYDVPREAWYYTPVNYLGIMGILNGKQDGYFFPDSPLTRAEFVTMLMRIAPPEYQLDLNELSWDDIFYDVPADSWYRPYANWGNRTGIAVGYNGYFNGDSNITRQEMAKMISNFCNSVFDVQLVEQYNDITFADEYNIADWAKNEVHQMYKFGVLNGMPDGTFYPQGNATRAQAAKMIYLLYEVRMRVIGS